MNRQRSRLWGLAAGMALGSLLTAPARATPYVPADDSVILAELPAGAHYADLTARRLATARIDVALPLAQFYIRQSRQSGDLRYLGFADAVLTPWIDRRPVIPTALVLHATVQQSRHQFEAALSTLATALAADPGNAQALLTEATILRVLGRYDEAGAACQRLAQRVEPRLAALCIEGVRGLTGGTEQAYATVRALSTQGWLDAEKSWRLCELGEMARRLGRPEEAAHWFQQDLALAPEDFYVRGALADLLLDQQRAAETLQLLAGYESFETLLLRIAIAQRQLHDPALARSQSRLEAAFAAENLRGEAVHRREQARFLLEVQGQPQQALRVARENWRQQREPDDARILLAAAMSGGDPTAAAPALAMLRNAGVRESAWTAP